MLLVYHCLHVRTKKGIYFKMTTYTHINEERRKHSFFILRSFEIVMKLTDAQTSCIENR
jgi:hypothetical protein